MEEKSHKKKLKEKQKANMCLSGIMACISEDDWAMRQSLRSLRLYSTTVDCRQAPVQHNTQHQQALLNNYFIPKFVQATRFLRILALTGLVSASAFFIEAESQCPPEYWTEVYQEPYFYPSLTKVALSEPNLSQDHGNITFILVLAGRMAAQMPALRIMELWNAGEPYIFRYEVTSEEATLTVMAPYDVKPALSPLCVNVWQMVANRHDHLERRPLRITVYEIDVPDGESVSEATALRHLKLRHEIIDPRSRYQLECHKVAMDAFPAPDEDFELLDEGLEVLDVD